MGKKQCQRSRSAPSNLCDWSTASFERRRTTFSCSFHMMYVVNNSPRCVPSCGSSEKWREPATGHVRIWFERNADERATRNPSNAGKRQPNFVTIELRCRWVQYSRPWPDQNCLDDRCHGRSWCHDSSQKVLFFRTSYFFIHTIAIDVSEPPNLESRTWAQTCLSRGPVVPPSYGHPKTSLEVCSLAS